MLAGSLTEFTLPDIFQLLTATRKTGLLHLSDQGAHGRVWVLEGALAHAVSDVSRAPLAARLLHGGEIGADDIEPIMTAQAHGGPGQVGVALADAGMVPDRIRQVLADQIVDAVFELSRWSEGEFSFEADTATAVDGPVIPAADVLEAVGRRATEWDSIVAKLPSPTSVLTPVGRPPAHNGVIQVTAEQWEVFTLVDGIRTVADVITLTGQGQFVVARLLADLVGAGLLRVDEGGGSETLTRTRARTIAQAEHEILGASRPAAPAMAPVGRQQPPPPSILLPDDDIEDDEPEPGIDVSAFLASGDDTTTARQVDIRDQPTVDADRDDVHDDADVAHDGDSDDRDDDLLTRLIDGVKGA
jgi:hypothetical protein